MAKTFLDATGLSYAFTRIKSMINTAVGSLTAEDVGAATEDHTHAPADIGAAAASHSHAAGDITSGTLGVTRGGTGVTSNPSMLTDLGSTTAADVFAESPRPGVTGMLPIANGGTGATTAAEALTALGASAEDHSHDAMTGASADAAGAAGMVPAPAAGEQESFLRGDGTWGVPEKGVFIATYGETTLEEIGEAELAGKLLVCDFSSMMLPIASGIRGIFYNFYGGTGEDGYMAQIQSDGTWTNTQYGGYTPKDHTHTVSQITDFPSTETWTFTLEDGSTVTKAVYIG